jgi:excinuclease ABC subunit C
MQGSSYTDKDIIAYAMDENSAVVQVFFIRNSKLLGREHFYLKKALQETGNQVLESFIKQYYSAAPFVPSELLIQDEIQDATLISEWLEERRGGKVHIKRPKKGEKEKLVELARKNAELILTQNKDKMKRDEQQTKGALKELRESLGLETLSRVESFDISNTGGYDSVASMVVYENGKPRKNEYRKFKIKSVKGPMIIPA